MRCCAVHLVASKMATVQEHARCVGWPFETKSVIQTQWNYRTHISINNLNVIRHQRLVRFLEAGKVHDRPRCGRPAVSDYVVERLQESFTRSPTQSTRWASRDLGVPGTIIHKVLHKRLRLNVYKVQLVQQLKPGDSIKCRCFAEEMLDRTDHYADFIKKIMFSDEATFHVSGKVHRQSVRIWRTKIHILLASTYATVQKLMCGVV
jgi:hypothetical protein